MKIRLFCSCSFLIWISSLKIHVEDTCFFHEANIMKQYVTTMYRLFELKFKEWFYEFISMYMYSLSVFRVSVLGRRPWNVLCWGNNLSASFADKLRYSLFFWKGHSHL